MLILADEMREERPLDSDAHNLATLLLLRDLRHRQGLATVRAQQKAMGVDDLQPKHGHKHRHKHNKKDATIAEVVEKEAPQPKGFLGKMAKGISRRVLQRSNSKSNLQSSSLSSIPKPSTPERVRAMNQRLGSASNGLAAPASPNGDSTQELSDSEGYPWNDHRPGTANTAASNDDTYSTAGMFSPSDATYQPKTPAEEKQGGEAFDAGLLRAIQIQRVNSMGHEALEEDDKSLIDSDDNKSLEKNTPRRGKGIDKDANGSKSDSTTRVAFTGPGGALEATSKSSTSKANDSPSKSKSNYALRKQRSVAAKAAAAAAMAEADMCMIAVEILDSRTKSTLQSEPSIRAAADYLLSHTTMSKVLAMVLMQREVKGVLEELLSEEGQSFFVHQATRYSGVNEVASFWDIASRALSCGEVLVGYRPTSSGTTIINPLAKDEPRTWGEYDLIVVCCDTAAMMTPAKLAMKRLKRYSSLPINLLKGFANKKSSDSDGDASTVSNVFSRATAGAMAQGALWPRKLGAGTDATNSDNAAASATDGQGMPQLTLDSPGGQSSLVKADNSSAAGEVKKHKASQLLSPVAVQGAAIGSPNANSVRDQKDSASAGNVQAMPSVLSAGNKGSSQAPMLATVTAASEFTDQVRIFALNNAMDETVGPVRRKKRESESDVSDESGSSEYESESSDEIPKDGTGSFEVEDTPKTKLRKQRSEKRISKRGSPKPSREKVASASAAEETAAGGGAPAGSTQEQASSAAADHPLTRASPSPKGSPHLAPLNGRSVSPLPMTSPHERNLPSVLATPTRSANNSLERASTPDSMRSTSAL